MKKSKITEQITFFEPGSMARFSSCSGIIISDGNKKLLIDMNLGKKCIPDMIQSEQPDVAMVTHYHLDHSIWIRQLHQYSDAQVWIPRIEQDYYTSLDFVMENTARPFGLEKEWQQFIENTLGFQKLKHYHVFKEDTPAKEILPGLDIEMELVPTPGHSPGHTSFYFPNEKILFSGDMGLDRFGPWYGWNDCDIPSFISSLLLLNQLDIELILTSHGGIIKENIQQTWVDSIQHIWKRETEISYKLDAGMSKASIISEGIFYQNKDKVPEPMRSFLNMWDTAVLNHHTELIKQGGLCHIFPEIRDIV